MAGAWAHGCWRALGCQCGPSPPQAGRRALPLPPRRTPTAPPPPTLVTPQTEATQRRPVVVPLPPPLVKAVDTYLQLVRPRLVYKNPLDEHFLVSPVGMPFSESSLSTYWRSLQLENRAPWSQPITLLGCRHAYCTHNYSSLVRRIAEEAPTRLGGMAHAIGNSVRSWEQHYVDGRGSMLASMAVRSAARAAAAAAAAAAARRPSRAAAAAAAAAAEEEEGGAADDDTWGGGEAVGGEEEDCAWEAEEAEEEEEDEEEEWAWGETEDASMGGASAGVTSGDGAGGDSGSSGEGSSDGFVSAASEEPSAGEAEAPRKKRRVGEGGEAVAGAPNWFSLDAWLPRKR